MGGASSIAADVHSSKSDNKFSNDQAFLGVVIPRESHSGSPTNISYSILADCDKKRIPENSLSSLIREGVQNILSEAILSVNNKITRKESFTSTRPSTVESTPSCKSEVTERFMDSVYINAWLDKSFADSLFHDLAQIGEKSRPKDTSQATKVRSKYPLWAKYYGLSRKKDGARALDRWGSYHESWMRVEEPPACLKKCAQKLRESFHLSDDSVNSMVVNY